MYCCHTQLLVNQVSIIRLCQHVVYHNNQRLHIHKKYQFEVFSGSTHASKMNEFVMLVYLAVFSLFVAYFNYLAMLFGLLTSLVFGAIGPFLLTNLGFTRRGIQRGTVASYISSAAKKTRLTRKIFGLLQSLGVTQDYMKITHLGGFLGGCSVILIQLVIGLYDAGD
ncbi:uncharacterized protein LOC131929075 [Physella acuta]|uniref:uncharacterized protein LOC131929075 n=1 Tax=Physella acuta TaxID=109671 RepID=UPI0027DCD298|nr:uncharacterized protein LOC131929075 [Physella acuta]